MRASLTAHTKSRGSTSSAEGTKRSTKQKRRPTLTPVAEEGDTDLPPGSLRTSQHHTARDNRDSNNTNSTSTRQFINAGFKQLDALQKWVLERTIDFVPGMTTAATAATTSTEEDPIIATSLDPQELQYIYQTYGREIKADPHVQSLQKQIRAMRQHVRDQRTQREKLQRKHAALLQKEQRHVDGVMAKVQAALDATASDNKNRGRDYARSLKTANQRKKGGKPKSAITATAKAVMNAPVKVVYPTAHSLTIIEKEVASMEITILRHMHLTMAYQNQCDVMQQYQSEVVTMLRHERVTLDNEHAQVARQRMILNATQNSMAELYPEICSRQEALLHQFYYGCPINVHEPSLHSSGSTSGGGEHRPLTNINVLIKHQQQLQRKTSKSVRSLSSFEDMMKFKQQQRSTNSLDSSHKLSSIFGEDVSDLGESVNGEEESHSSYDDRVRRQPVITSAHELQQQALQTLQVQL